MSKGLHICSMVRVENTCTDPGQELLHLWCPNLGKEGGSPWKSRTVPGDTEAVSPGRGAYG